MRRVAGDHELLPPLAAHLEPTLAPARRIGRVGMLRDDALKPVLARHLEERRAISAHVIAVSHERALRLGEDLREPGLALRELLAPQVAPPRVDQVEDLVDDRILRAPV